MKTKIIIITLILVFLVTTGFSCRYTPGDVAEQLKPVKLTWWRVWDTSDNFSSILSNYKVGHPHISIAYKKLRYEEYEQVLLEAWAEDQGPDIFSIPVTWLRKYQSKIAPMPESTRVPELRVSGSSWKPTEEIITPITPGPTPNDLKTKWVPTVYEDVIIENEIWGLPLGIDTLVLFYNQDLLDKAKIAFPPKTWTEFKDQVKKLTLIDEQSNIVQAGAPLGTAANVTRNTDILSLLMLQNGVEMPNFSSPSKFDSSYFPGQEALRFYLSFADPAKEVYTWNEEMPNSLDAFIAGKVAFFFGYSYHLPIVQARAPKLNFQITPVPQITSGMNDINHANYWIEVVAKKSPHQNEAWNFVQFASSQGQVLSYLQAAKKPTALRALIAEQEKDYDIQAFVAGVLTTKNWYHGKDFNRVEEIFKEMITNVHQGSATIPKAIDFAAKQVGVTY
ncbi:extracellular solute-binding protein [Patescibacteria group bacterium]|nr:extracellular solute-binding protein [Patescibacteria group bacterium]MBU4512561.1 extracellular solute-binding protein [Patescibacteria group bacterium]MCG2692975.1 extracellular solute-binding protein [Candidatus Parcubacteria bacterium]